MNPEGQKVKVSDIGMRFLGTTTGKTDAKGRVFLPSGFRKTLQSSGEDSLVLRRDVFQPCLVFYPQSVWNSQMDQLRSRLNRWNSDDQQLFRQFVSDVEQLSLDASGRLLIPKRYLAMASIVQDVTFIGMGDTIELWATEKRVESTMAPADFALRIKEAMV